MINGLSDATLPVLLQLQRSSEGVLKAAEKLLTPMSERKERASVVLQSRARRLAAMRLSARLVDAKRDRAATAVQSLARRKSAERLVARRGRAATAMQSVARRRSARRLLASKQGRLAPGERPFSSFASSKIALRKIGVESTPLEKLAWAVALVVVCSLALWSWQAGRHHGQQAAVDSFVAGSREASNFASYNNDGTKTISKIINLHSKPAVRPALVGLAATSAGLAAKVALGPAGAPAAELIVLAAAGPAVGPAALPPKAVLAAVATSAVTILARLHPGTAIVAPVATKVLRRTKLWTSSLAALKTVAARMHPGRAAAGGALGVAVAWLGSA